MKVKTALFFRKILYDTIIVLDSVCRIKKSYNPHIFVEQFKYKGKEREIANFIPEEVESSFDEDDEDSDGEGFQ